MEFIRILPSADDRAIRITGNHFVGTPTADHIEVGADSIVVRDMLATSIVHPHAREAIALLAPRPHWWRRAIVAVARWLLRRVL